MSAPFPLVEAALIEMIQTIYAPADGKAGTDLAYDPSSEELYFMVGLVPGSGTTDQTSGSWAVDVEVFATNYYDAMNASLELEPLLLKGLFHASETGMIIDSVFQNSAPSERPWLDDETHRVGATYVLSARRSG